jgi:hypothetical protein
MVDVAKAHHGVMPAMLRNARAGNVGTRAFPAMLALLAFSAMTRHLSCP